MAELFCCLLFLLLLLFLMEYFFAHVIGDFLLRKYLFFPITIIKTSWSAF